MLNTPASCHKIETPIGDLFASAREGKICLLLFADDPCVQGSNDQIGPMVENKAVIELLEEELRAYFLGTLKAFSVPLSFSGTTFQQKVWKKVQEIPFGTTLTYGNLALDAGGKEKTRAVAGANSRNQLLLLVPCHRVVGEGKRLTGFRGGLERKRWLIEFERSHSKQTLHSTLF